MGLFMRDEHKMFVVWLRLDCSVCHEVFVKSLLKVLLRSFVALVCFLVYMLIIIFCATRYPVLQPVIACVLEKLKTEIIQSKTDGSEAAL